MIQSKLELIPITDKTNPLLEEIEKTYNESFPPEERREFFLVKELIENQGLFSMLAIVKNNNYVGFFTIWHFADFSYGEHFALNSSARNGGIGGEAFKMVLERTTHPFILEVELPNDEMSTRRIGFYQRLGLELDSHTYYQPPYRKGEEGLEMRLMKYGNIDLDKDFDKVKSIIYRYVYNAE